LFHFSNTKYAETGFVKTKEYAHKKTMDLRTTPAFLFAIIHKNTT